MHFGIMPIQINKLIPPGLSPDQVFTHLASFNHTELVRSLATKGFELIEIGGDLSIFLQHKFENQVTQQLVSVKGELEVRYTVHLPLWSVEPSTPHKFGYKKSFISIGKNPF